MIRAVVHKGRVKPQDPILDEWEGQTVKIVPLTPDDPIPDLEERLAVLHALGPMEFDEGEQETIERWLKEQDQLSRAPLK